MIFRFLMLRLSGLFASAYFSISRLQRWGFYLLLGFCLSLLFLVYQAQAAGTVILQFRDRTLAVPLHELQTFAENIDASPEIQQFVQSTEQDPAAVRRWLNAALIPPRQLRSTNRDFALTQINKTVGNPLGRGSLEPLQTSFQRSMRNDNRFSVLELIENFPSSTVRLELSRLEQVYGDVDLLLTRIEPTLQAIQPVLARFACDCDVAMQEDGAIAYAQTRDTLKTLQPAVSDTRAEKTGFSTGIDPSLIAQLPSDDPTLNSRNLIIQFGLLGRTIPLQDLTRFAETGELSRGWRNNFNLAGVDPENVRTALNQQVPADVLFLDSSLNNLLGEYLLFQIGQVVGTQANTANIQAMRSAVVLSAADDNRLSLLEIIQRYPTPNIFVDARELARFGRSISRFSASNAISTVGFTLEDWFLDLQAAAIENLCTCEGGPILSDQPVPPPVAPTITPEQVAQFLPANWQPITPHRENHGIIRVVWLQGTPYEMGYQHGQFLHDEIASLGSKVLGGLRFAGGGLGLGKFAASRSYPEVLEECRGLTAATQDIGMTFDACLVLAYGDVFQELFGNTLPNILFWDGCSQWVASGEATVDGRLYHGSTLDNSQRPIPYIVNNPVVFVRQPTDGLPHVFITYPGVVWPNWGLNVAGITLGLDSLHPRSLDEMNLNGRSDVQIMAQALKTSTTFAEARQLMVSEPSARANLIMATDGKSKEAGVFEIVGRNVGVRELQDNGVLYVTNHIELPEMYERQQLPVNESSTTRFKRFSQLMEPDGVNTLYGQLNPTGMVKIGRDRTNPNTLQPSPLTVFDDDASPGGNGSLRQGVYDPDKLLLWVAAGQPPVPENPFVCFSLGEMLNFPNAIPCDSPSK